KAGHLESRVLRVGITRVLAGSCRSPFGGMASAVSFRPDADVIRELPRSQFSERQSARPQEAIARETEMRKRNALAAAMAFAAMVSTPFGNAGAFDESKYPSWKGQWMRADAGAPRYDPSKPSGRGQQAPLKPEFQAFLEASIAEQRTGGQGGDPTYTCLSPGMPRIMNNFEGPEFV